MLVNSPEEVHIKREAIVEVGKGNAVLSSDWLSDDDLVDVIELIPVFISEEEKEKIKRVYTCIHNGYDVTNPISCCSFTRGSNFGPPGMARLSALAVKNDLRSNR